MTTVFTFNDELMIIDVTSENLVSFTTALGRQESTPESAMQFAKELMYREPSYHFIANALQEAAKKAVERRNKKRPLPS